MKQFKLIDASDKVENPEFEKLTEKKLVRSFVLPH
jgi:hypothetical protein